SPPSVSPPTTSQGVMSKTNTGSPTSKPTMPPNTSSARSSSGSSDRVLLHPVTSSSTAQMTSPTNATRKPSSIPTLSPSPTPGISPTSKPGDPPPIPVPSPSAKPSAGPGPLVSTTTVLSSVVQHQNSLSGSSGSSQTTPAATSPRAAPGIHSLEQLPSTAASTTTPAGSLSPDLKDHISSTKSVSQQPHSSPSSEVQGPASSPRPASVSTSAAPSAGSVSPTTSKTTQSLTPGSIDKVSLPATTLTSGAAQTSHGQGPTPTKPVIADQSPTTAQTLSPTSSHQMTSSRPGPQHPNDTFQNEVICEDQMQNSWPIISLKEAKTCAEWKTLTHNGSLFKTFCSTDRYTYEPSRDTCTVTLASAEPRSQRWAVRAVVHREYALTPVPGGGDRKDTSF
ncbi:PODXL protein, partial [Nothocercus nigrocapillus]|nr:PODXL protein [Nothocercus nigrocapillus]